MTATIQKHVHTIHLHELSYCPQCDVVYCERCDRQWTDPAPAYPAPPIPGHISFIPGTVTPDSFTDGSHQAASIHSQF